MYAALGMGSGEDRGGIEAGTVGWDDGEPHFDTSPAEMVLVKVTLFRGRNPDRDPELKPGRAGGQEILARISAPLNYIPPDGAEVLVAVPGGFGIAPGAAVIIAQPAAAPANQFSESRAKMDFGPDVDVVIKARSVTLTDYEDRYLTVGPRFGIKAGDADANGMQLKGGKWMLWTAVDEDARAVLQLSGTDVRLSHKGADGKKTNIKLKAGDVTFSCEGNFIASYKMGWLGAKAPVPLPPPLPVAAGPSPGTVSSNTFVTVA